MDPAIWRCGIIALCAALAPAGIAAAQGPPVDELAIQRPGVRLFGAAGLASRSEERDILLKDYTATNLGAGVAYYGFGASFWVSRDWDTGGDVGEALLGYSYKLPIVDAHAGLVSCRNEILAGGCKDAARLAFTTNSMRRTTLELVADLAGGERTVTSIAVTRDLYSGDRFNGSVRVGWTEDRRDVGRLEAVSARVMGRVPLQGPASLDVAVGHHWNLRRADLPLPSKGGFLSVTLAVRR